MSLLRDERGAILVLGVFLATFMAGMLLYCVSLAETIYLRERLQDGADAAAFSAAVTCARGMNVIVLINLVMAGLLAVLIALRVVELLVIAAIAVISAFAWTGGAAFIPPLEKLRQTTVATRNRLKKPVFAALRAMRTTARSVRTVVPTAAQGNVLDVANEYAPGVSFAFAIPSRWTLPVEDDEFGVLCDHAGQFVGEIALAPVKPLLPDFAHDTVVDALGSASAQASAYFCGKSGGKRPSIEVKTRIVLPRLPEREACVAAAKAGKADSASSCEDADDAESRFRMDGAGNCLAECEPGGAYDSRVGLARQQCDPREGRFSGYVWQYRKFVLAWEHRAGEWLETERRPLEAARLVREGRKSRRHPCGTDRAVHSEDYNRELREPKTREYLPVCRETVDEIEKSDTRIVAEVVEVQQIFSCEYQKTERVRTGEDFEEDRKRREQAAKDHRHSPQRVERGVELGGEDFMLRVTALGPSERLAGDGVRVAAWGADVANSLLPFELPRLALAQAEYFFDGKEPREEWMWQMKWRARLRRVRWPESRKSGSGGAGKAASDGPDRSRTGIREACNDRGGAKNRAGCNDASSRLESITRWMVH